MLTDNKTLKLAFKIVTAASLIAAAICLICNFALSKSLTWAGYPLIAIPFAWLIVFPLLLFKKHRVVFSLTAVSVLTIPFLYLLERLTPVKEWFAALGVPVAVTGIAAVWITYFLIKYVRTNWWYLSAMLMFLYGVAASAVVNYFTSIYLGSAFFSLSNIINFLSCALVTVLLVIIGRYKNVNERLKSQNEDSK